MGKLHQGCSFHCRCQTRKDHVTSPRAYLRVRPPPPRLFLSHLPMVSQSSADLLLLDIPSAQTHTSHPSSPSMRQLSSRQRFGRDTFAQKDKTLWAIRSEAHLTSLNRAPRIAAGMSAIFPDRVSSQHLMTYLATDSRSSFLDRFHSRGHSVPLRPSSLFVDNKTPLNGQNWSTDGTLEHEQAIDGNKNGKGFLTNWRGKVPE